jgi:hypothetical protein
MKKIIYQIGLHLGRNCINLMAKWLLHTNHLGKNEDPSLFTYLETLEETHL